MTNKELRELYEKTKADAAAARAPKITLKETIERCYQLAMPPGTPPLRANALDLMASGTARWMEHQLKFDMLPKQLQEIETMLIVHETNEILETRNIELTNEVTELRKLVEPKPDKP